MTNEVFSTYLQYVAPIIFTVMAFYVADRLIKLMTNAFLIDNDR